MTQKYFVFSQKFPPQKYILHKKSRAKKTFTQKLFDKIYLLTKEKFNFFFNWSIFQTALTELVNNSVSKFHADNSIKSGHPGCEILWSVAKQVDSQLAWKIPPNFRQKEVTHKMPDKCYVAWGRKKISWPSQISLDRTQ